MRVSDFASILWEVRARELARGVKVGDLNQDIRLGWKPTGDDFQIPHSCQIRSAAAVFVAPAFAGLETQSFQECRKLVELLRGASQTIYGEGLDHRLTALEICCSLLEKGGCAFLLVLGCT